MGMFSYVVVSDSFLPVEVRGMTGWQTKDVIEPLMETLIITDDGDLFRERWGVRTYDDPSALFGFRTERTKQSLEKLDYHGDMVFYTSNDDPNVDPRLIECLARFDDGKLRGISYLGLWPPNK